MMKRIATTVMTVLSFVGLAWALFDPLPTNWGSPTYPTELRTTGNVTAVNGSFSGTISAVGLTNTGQETVSGTFTVVGNAMSVGVSTLVVTGGQVGIGNTSPAYTFDITGGHRVTGQQVVGGTSTVQGNAFSVGGSTLVVKDGLIGVGTTSPAYDLDVTDDLRATDQGIFGGTLTVQGNALSVGVSTFAIVDGKAGVGTSSPQWSLDVSSVVNTNHAQGYWMYGLPSMITSGTVTAVGQRAGAANQAGGVSNTYLGDRAGGKVTTGDNNIYLGAESGFENLTGAGQTCIGYQTCYNATGNNVTAVGQGAGQVNGSGIQNSYFGVRSNYSNSTGQDILAAGYEAGYGNTGSRSVFLGSEAGYNNTGGDGVFLGYRAGYYTTAANLLVIHNNNSTTPLIRGDFAAYKVGIGTGTPVYTLDVAGDIRSTGSVIVQSTLTVQGNAFSVGVSTLVVKDGTVGIGTTSPAYDLDVTDDLRATDQGIFGGTVTVQGNALSVGVSSFVVVGSFVGIRTASPVYALDVSGDERVAGQQIIVGTSTVLGNAFSIGSSSFSVANGAINYGIYTKAQIDLRVPVLGESVLCSNCTYPYDVCIGTIAAVSGYRATVNSGVAGSAKGCGINE